MAVWGINISLRVIDWRKKKGSYLTVFKAAEEKILCLKFNLGPAVNPTGRLHPEKYICLRHKHLAPEKYICLRHKHLAPVL
jgi:hypothetical protein